MFEGVIECLLFDVRTVVHVYVYLSLDTVVIEVRTLQSSHQPPQSPMYVTASQWFAQQIDIYRKWITLGFRRFSYPTLFGILGVRRHYVPKYL